MPWNRYMAQLSELKGRELQRDQTFLIATERLCSCCCRRAARGLRQLLYGCLHVWYRGGLLVLTLYSCGTAGIHPVALLCQDIKKMSMAVLCNDQKWLVFSQFPYPVLPCRRLVSVLLLQSPGVLHEPQILGMERNCTQKYISAPNPLQIP